MLVKMSGDLTSNDTLIQNEKRALLVYAGTFQSMDGEVVITPAHIEVLKMNHNERINKHGDMIQMSDYPPVQIDHSTSARDTVGRLVGPVDIGTHDGQVALFGRIRILGVDNWERVVDGRWTHLSIGADLEAGVIHEVTITPFPAAQNACFLSKKGTKMAGNEVTDNEKETKEEKEEARLKKIKLEEDAEKKKEEEEDEENDKKLKAKLSAFSVKSNSIRLKLKTASIQSRFARLKSQCKVTPAELKKVDFVKFCACNDATIDAVLKTYENREPVIVPGQFGSVTATNASEIAKSARLSALRDETRKNFSSVKPNGTAAKVNLSEGIKITPPGADAGETDKEARPEWDEMKRLMAEDEGKAKDYFAKMCRTSTAEGETDMAELMSAFADMDNDHAEIVRLMSSSKITRI